MVSSTTLSLLLQLLHLFFFFLYSVTVSVSGNVEFIFHGFNETETSTNLTRDGASMIKPSGALRLTDMSHGVIGHAFYPYRIQMFDKNSSALSTKASSFSTYFVFAIHAPSPGQGGYGLVFTVAPSTQFPGAAAEHYMGIFNSSNEGNSSNHVFAVEFDTVNGHRQEVKADTRGNHVGINNNSMVSRKLEPAAYYLDGRKEEMELESGHPVQAWIEYDGVKQVVTVTISPFNEEKPSKPLLTEEHIDLSPVFKEAMFVGFSASTGTRKASSHYLLGWSFSMNGSAPPLNLSILPIPPFEKINSSSLTPQIKILIAVLSALTIIFLGFFTCLKLYRRISQFEILEDWEFDCPHRFRYKDLHTATKGFKESEVIGVGGFGAVYKGVLPTSSGNEVAVKRISRNSIQGMREFAAEIESLGRLRHKNLINLQGWCKRKKDLLLVYDYIPNGSLDSLLFHPIQDSILSWNQRLNIIKGIASGLLYLHEEWDQVVIHRDVKSSNVLIDSDMNARLGDFGLARLFDHGSKVAHTTNVVGTVGYIAPELARTGKSSASTDVFAFGVLLLEMATGRRPIDSDNFILVDWVLEFQQLGRILDVVDPKLGSRYQIDEIELVLVLGLICSHRKPEARPTMRQVLKYLNENDQLLRVIENWNSVESQLSEMNSRLSTITTSNLSFSIGGISSGSLGSGRR